jgi:hypothetical protein
VLVALEADVDVDGGGSARLGEGEGGHCLPHAEGLPDQGRPRRFLSIEIIQSRDSTYQRQSKS